MATALTFEDGTHRTWVDISARGTFKTRLPSGSHTVGVFVFKVAAYEFVGWFNGMGVTTEPEEGLKVAVDWRTEDIQILLPENVDSLLCAEGGSRSQLSGECQS